LGTCLSQDFFITKANDTTFCNNIEYSGNAQGFISNLSYINRNGSNEEKSVPKIKLITISGILYEPMPLKTNKPDSYYRVGKRVVEGRLKVSVYNDLETKLVFEQKSVDNRTGAAKNETSGTCLFQLRLHDGKLIKEGG
jgi:hypothetical protein